MRGVKVRVAHAIGEGNAHHGFAYARAGLAILTQLERTVHAGRLGHARRDGTVLFWAQPLDDFFLRILELSHSPYVITF